MNADTHTEPTLEQRAHRLAYQMVAGAACGGPVDEAFVERLAKRIEAIEARRRHHKRPEPDRQPGQAE